MSPKQEIELPKFAYPDCMAVAAASCALLLAEVEIIIDFQLARAFPSEVIIARHAIRIWNEIEIIIIRDINKCMRVMLN